MGLKGGNCPLLAFVKKRQAKLRRYLEHDDFLAWADCLLDCDEYPEYLNSMCIDLQVEMLETLLDAVEFPEEREQTAEYLLKQLHRYDKETNDIKRRYNDFMYRIGDTNILTKSGREKANYDPLIMQKNLQFQDLKCELMSYLEGYHKDKCRLYRWLITIMRSE